MSHDNDPSERELVGFLGVGLDNKDGHQRLTRTEHFFLVGGSPETHERMQDAAGGVHDGKDDSVSEIEDLLSRGQRFTLSVESESRSSGTDANIGRLPCRPQTTSGGRRSGGAVEDLSAAGENGLNRRRGAIRRARLEFAWWPGKQVRKADRGSRQQLHTQSNRPAA